MLSDAVFVHCGRKITENDIQRTERGKPYFRDIPLHFGISHCKGCALCGISDTPIGIDCEAVRKFTERTAKYAFTPEETALAGGSDEKLSRLWSLKESYVKFTGTGLAGHMNDAVFLSLGEYPTADIKYGKPLYFRQFGVGGDIFVSVCSEQSTDKITILL